MINLGNAFILGDSYSTFKDYIPKGFSFWYSNVEKEETDVIDVSQTWWWQLINSTDSQLVRNCSWSGSTICNTCRPTFDVSTSFINRFEKLVNEGFFEQNEINTFFVFGGTNDSWINSPVGELVVEGWNDEQLLCVLPAVSYLFYRIKTVIPNARVINLINTNLKEVIVEGIKKSAEHFGVEYLQLENISKQNGHPDIKGMVQIKNQIIDYLNR